MFRRPRNPIKIIETQKLVAVFCVYEDTSKIDTSDKSALFRCKKNLKIILNPRRYLLFTEREVLLREALCLFKKSFPRYRN